MNIKQLQTTAITASVKTGTLEHKPPTSISRLSIITAIQDGTPLQSVRRDLGISNSSFQYHLNILKDHGLIRKVGYGTWDLVDEPVTTKKRTTISGYVGQSHSGGLEVRETEVLQGVGSAQGVVREPGVGQALLQEFIPDGVRAHGFVFRLEVPHDLRNWSNIRRAEFLRKAGVPFKSLGIAGGGQRITINDRKVWLTDASVIIYDRASYFAEDALNAKSTALSTHISIIKKVERLLRVSLEIGSDYKFRISRQHYALLQNALAKQYNSDGEKLEIRNGRGLWFLIDNSYNLNEAECIHPSTAMTDTNKVQGFFNGLKAVPAGEVAYTPEFVLKAMVGIQGNQAVFAENMVSHVAAIQELGAGVAALVGVVKDLKAERL